MRRTEGKACHCKVFIATNQEYGKKFYTWNWNYLKKRGSQFVSMGKNNYTEMEYGHMVPEHENFGQGLGTFGTQVIFSTTTTIE